MICSKLFNTFVLISIISVIHATQAKGDLFPLINHEKMYRNALMVSEEILVQSIADDYMEIWHSFTRNGFPVPNIKQFRMNLQSHFLERRCVCEFARELLYKIDQLLDDDESMYAISDQEEDPTEEEGAKEDKQEVSKHFEKAVEYYLWGAAEIAIGVVETVRGDLLGGALILGDGVRNCKEAWDELQEAIAEKKDDENKKAENEEG